jgi:hypothetical protein
MKEGVHQIALRLPVAELRVLDGQRHFAITSAPELFVTSVLV